MKRIILDYSNLNQDLLDLLFEIYPEGYEYDDILRFQTKNGESIKAIELRTSDAIYLIKVSTDLDRVMNQYPDLGFQDDFNIEELDEF